MKPNEQFLKAFDKYLKENKIEMTEENAQHILNRFTKIYNEQIALQENGLNESLERKDEERTYKLYQDDMEMHNLIKKQKLLKRALKRRPDFIDAKLEAALHEKDHHRQLMQLEKMEAEEKAYLEKKGLFEKVPHFYSIPETRFYIRLHHAIAVIYQKLGCNKKAMATYEHILALNENDNLDCRFELMGLYTLFEESEKMSTLLEKYQEKSVPAVLFQSILYFKQNDLPTAKQYVYDLFRMVPDLKRMMMDELEEEDFYTDTPEGYYRPYSLEEVMMYMKTYEGLFVDALMDFYTEVAVADSLN